MSISRQPATTTLKGRVVRYIALAAFLSIVGAAVAFAVGASAGAAFTSTGRVLVRPPLTAQMVVTGNPGAAEDIQRVVDTDVAIANSRAFLNRVATRVGITGVTTDSLVKELTVTAPTGTDVLLLTISEPTGPMAEAVTAGAVDEFVSYLNSLSGDTSGLNSSDSVVQAALDRLKVLQQLVPAATVVDRASSAVQTLPNHARDVLVGGTAGLVAALIVIAFRESLRYTPLR